MATQNLIYTLLYNENEFSATTISTNQFKRLTGIVLSEKQTSPCWSYD
jgi:hypothetical protein